MFHRPCSLIWLATCIRMGYTCMENSTPSLSIFLIESSLQLTSQGFQEFITGIFFSKGVVRKWSSMLRAPSKNLQRQRQGQKSILWNNDTPKPVSICNPKNKWKALTCLLQRTHTEETMVISQQHCTLRQHDIETHDWALTELSGRDQQICRIVNRILPL